jgi:hypothetical protein
MIFESLGVLEYSTITFFMRADWGMIVLDVGLEKRPFVE